MIALSTTTLMAALRSEPSWPAQIELARQLERREDVFNVLPLCEFLIEAHRNRDVQKAVARCVAVHGGAEAIGWLERIVLNPGRAVPEKLLALRALADLGMPASTMPVLRRLCRAAVPVEVKRSIIFRLGRSGRLEIVGPLAKLASHQDNGLASEAREALPADCVTSERAVPALAKHRVRERDTAPLWCFIGGQ